MSLPSLSVSIHCGSCFSRIEHDGDQYVCFDCGLCWPSNDPFGDDPAEFMDEEASSCGHPANDAHPHVSTKPFRTFNGVAESWRTYTTTYDACHLPEGHKGDHDHPLQTTYVEQTEKP